MTAQDIIAALDLPNSCLVNQRVPKKLLIENGAPTASDKRQINDSIDEIQWLAALKPNTIGVPEYRDDVREYLEIAVLSVTLRSTDNKPLKIGRLAELLHRAVPYPMLLLLNTDQGLIISLAHKRWAQNEADKVVLDGGLVIVTLPSDAPLLPVEKTFMQSIALGYQPKATLYALYQGWMDSLQALLAARLTGAFKIPDTPEQAAERRAALRRCGELDAQVASLQLAASKEKQMARQIALNVEIKGLHAERVLAAAHL